MPSDVQQASRTFHIGPIEKARAFLGRQDRHLRLLRDAFGIRVSMRGDMLTLDGDPPAVQSAAKAVAELLELLRLKPHLTTAEVEDAIACSFQTEQAGGEVRVDVFGPGRGVRPRTPGQASYIRAMAENDIVFCIGPAGSGKTYLAVAMAVSALKRDAARKIVLTRPAVEAGERLGFLPGDMQAKVDPYLRPLYDALHDMMSLTQLQQYVENDVIEVAPLAYMRGRNLDRAFIILDEGQNCTRKQMQMFLTRLGASSKSVVTGDISQTDLPGHEPSGMVEAMGLLRGISGIGFVALTQRDIIRHRLVQDIVDAYDARDKALTAPPSAPERPS